MDLAMFVKYIRDHSLKEKEQIRMAQASQRHVCAQPSQRGYFDFSKEELSRLSKSYLNNWTIKIVQL